MSKGQKAVPIDPYVYGLLQQMVDQGKASNLADAIHRSVAQYLGIRYKTKKERDIVRELQHVLELAKLATERQTTIIGEQKE